MTRLDTLSDLPASVTTPSYDPAAHGAGIVHFGPGAFHRAHAAAYTDTVLGAAGGDWRITGVSLRRRDVADQLNPQNGLYTLVVRGPGAPELRVIGAIDRVLFAPEEGEAVLERLCAPQTRIVSLTITEKGYGYDSATGGLDRKHGDIAADLASDLSHPRSAVGWIVAALARRRAAGAEPFTVLSCDNLAGNGAVVRTLVTEFARERDAALADWIAQAVPFPSTMVDRITPTTSDETLALVRETLGREDKAAVETEPFSQWVIEDTFCAGRPDWEQAGALMVDDVAPYESMKLRMLNGSHSLIAYAGFVAGHTYVRDAMGDDALVALVRRHMRAAAATLAPVPGIDLGAYENDLVERFANPAIAHATYQIAMDGTQKLPQRVFEPAMVALEAGQPIESFAFVMAAWMAYARGEKADKERYALRDPRENEIADAMAHAGSDPNALADALLDLPGLMPRMLAESAAWRAAVSERFTRFVTEGAPVAIRAEAAE